ncbi:TetR/AcrR family transcriptional regulator [Actinomadura madurae]|uniref:TetR/AcrR family transcriptional regulator n=1 Tax=Actinomadura madurae TaxID=1993 RepID=UPI0027E2756A|nr:TetR/AcrR family transcriptional regulator [Actinomadura madurae]
MARPRDPRRRVEILDAVLDHLAEHGMSGLSMRPIAQALGQRHPRPDPPLRRQGRAARCVAEAPGRDPARAAPRDGGLGRHGPGIGAIVRASWDRHLAPENIAHTRLVREIEGSPPPGASVTGYRDSLAERAEFVAGALTARGLDPAQARVKATFLNSAYAGLQTDRPHHRRPGTGRDRARRTLRARRLMDGDGDGRRLGGWQVS